MGALPKKKISKSRRGMRRSHDRLKPPALAECPQCHQLKIVHRTCPHCGTYNGRQILEVKGATGESR